jgi:hypothetical protein
MTQSYFYSESGPFDERQKVVCSVFFALDYCNFCEILFLLYDSAQRKICFSMVHASSNSGL